MRKRQKIQTIQIIQKRDKNIQRKVATSGLACKVFWEKKTTKCGKFRKHKKDKKVWKIQKRQKDIHNKITMSRHFSTPAKFQGKIKQRKRQKDIYLELLWNPAEFCLYGWLIQGSSKKNCFFRNNSLTGGPPPLLFRNEY